MALLKVLSLEKWIFVRGSASSLWLFCNSYYKTVFLLCVIIEEFLFLCLGVKVIMVKVVMTFMICMLGIAC